MVMKKVYWTLVAIFVAAALGGCVNDPTEMENAPDMSAGSRKILTLSLIHISEPTRH